MKTTLIIGALFFGGASMAQTTNAKVIYQETIKFKIDLEGEAAQFAHLMPKEQKSKYELHVTPSASLYKGEGRVVEQDIEQESEGGQMKIKMNRPTVTAFADLNKKKRIEQKEFMTRKFVVENDIDASKWKLTGQQKSILGYPCQQAVMEDSVQKVQVWFTPAIPVSTGPAGFEGLPGLVLSVDAMDGDYHIEATEINANAADVSLMVAPKEGKKMDKAAYDKMVKEKQAEMGITPGTHGKPNVVIRVENR